ncbi:MAG: chromosomal replication initiator protein DnaA [Planctomycetota bacterium]|nr:MAG: chromosomal replication initiator protein DnaA [Planctomycetota bacterium]REK21031.1 MAG: chromosomal replication initiator protein DnaA [Planctomycetota bacterium]REK38849.1 MAG: chromosomal replication initiator protein DnaA [Planctomycetota bacterium]
MPPVTDVDRAGLAQEARRILIEALEERRYLHWFEGKTRFHADGDELIVNVANPYLLNWIQKQFREALGEAALQLLGKGARLRFEVDATIAADGARPAKSPTQTSVYRKTSRPGGTSKAAARQYADLRSFVAGRCNELAHLAAIQVAEAPGARYTPLYLYGGVGNGKTHLLEGIYRRIRKDYPALQVLLLTGENFGNYFSQALSERTLPSFRQKFRNVDVLLLDDADFLDGKRAFQEEFLNTIKKLEREDRQIVVTADRHPRLLTRSSDELVSRLLSGLVCRIEAPDSDTRLTIVRQQAAAMKLDVDDAVLKFVADRFVNNVRELEGALNCLQTLHVMTGKRISVASARRILSGLERDCLRIVRIADVEAAVCKLFRVSSDELKSACRTRTVTQPRMLAMYLARRLTQSAYSEIGEYFGGRNHATVMSAERKISRLVEEGECVRVASESWPMHDLVASLEQQILAG